MLKSYSTHYRQEASTPGATVDFEALNLPRGDELEKRGVNTMRTPPTDIFWPHGRKQ